MLHQLTYVYSDTKNFNFCRLILISFVTLFFFLRIIVHNVT